MEKSTITLEKTTIGRIAKLGKKGDTYEKILKGILENKQ